MQSCQIISVSEASQVAHARQYALAIARSEGVPDLVGSNLALVVTEMGTNLVKYGGGGEIHLHSFHDASAVWMEAVSLDNGPGIVNVQECLRDGFSTGKTIGTGLGAIRRLSQEFDIYSQFGKGTAVLSRLSTLRDRGAYPVLQIGWAQAPNRGEEICGDAWTLCRDAKGMLVAVADGLGHGPQAAIASSRAVSFVQDNEKLDLIPQLQSLHQFLRGTRGAAIALAQVSLVDRSIRFAGLGNIAGVIVSASKTQHMVSQNGTAGVEARRFQEFGYAWPLNAALILHSDGLGTKWNLEAYPGLAERHAGLIAAVLYRDWSRRQDDVTVVVVKEPMQPV